MPLTCNIDSQGKRARLIIGIISVLVGIILTILVFTAVMPTWGYFIAAGALIGGAFGIFEARAGWCAVRAMGIRTPI